VAGEWANKKIKRQFPCKKQFLQQEQEKNIFKEFQAGFYRFLSAFSCFKGRKNLFN
jgi:hypothetical protein